MGDFIQSIIHLPYYRFSDAQKQLAKIEAIDYFFAKQLTELLIVGSNHSDDSTNVLFHLLVALNMSLREGHSCLPIKEIAHQQFGYRCDDSGGVSHQGFYFPPIEQLKQILLGLKVTALDQEAIVWINQRLYIRRYYQFEQEVLKFIDQEHHQSDEKPIMINEILSIKTCLEKLFPNDIKANKNEAANVIDWQKIAVANALNKRFSIIAGGPGTGKTYTVTKLLAALIELNQQEALKISLVAPTGKAAQRLSESIIKAVLGFNGLISNEVLQLIPKQAQTIHRLLGGIPHSPNFRHDSDNKLSVDVLLIDEASMVDLPLMARVFRALPHHCKVILLGDSDQLPSVAAGSILADLTPFDNAQFSAKNKKYLAKVTSIKSLPLSKNQPLDHVTYLTHSRRFDGEGGIGLLAKSVIAGNGKESWELLVNFKKNSEVRLIEQRNKLWLSALIQQYYKPLMSCNSVTEAFTLFAQFRLLTPTRSGEYGVEGLNQFVETELLQMANISMVSENNLFHAKPIMVNENNYALGLYNGDIGFIWKNEKGHLVAIFEKEDGDHQSVLPSRLPKFESVYAMTIHKTQGSEFEHVVMVLPNQSESQLLTRELLYTGITRAKNQLTIQSERSVWNQAVDKKILRHSGIVFNEH